MREMLKKESKNPNDRMKMDDDMEVADMNVTFDFNGKALMIKRVKPEAQKYLKVGTKVDVVPSKIEKSTTMKMMADL